MKGDEHELLRSAALQNASSILIARQRAERRSEAYLAEAQRLSHTGSFGWRPSTGEIIWSEETFRIFEYDRSAEPTVGLVLQRVHPEDAALVKQKIECASQDGKDFDFEHRLLMPDGSIKYVHVVAHALNDESGNIEFVGAVTDTTEGKRSEEALRLSEAYLAEGQRLSHTGSWHWNVGTGEVVWSQEALAILGLDSEKTKPSYPLFLERVHPEDRFQLDERLQAAVREKRDFEGEYRVLLPGGLIKYLHSIGRCSVGQSGDIEYNGVAMDITERKRAEEERERLRQARTDLAHLNRVSTMGELTASLAHEIKQPIFAASVDAETCLRWLARNQPDLAEAREAALRLMKDVTRASDIINRIVSLFKKGAPQRELVDVNGVVQEMIALMRSEAIRHSISIQTELTEDLPKIMADRVALQQVLMNLTLNAIEAMKEMSIPGKLTIATRQTEDRQLLISVMDTGVGLPPRDAEQIFSAFFTSKSQGTGMGLPISRSIIESHGGRLWATPNSPRGAIFQFTLPLEAVARQSG